MATLNGNINAQLEPVTIEADVTILGAVDLSQTQSVDSFHNSSVFGDFTSQNPGQLASITSLENISQFDDLQAKFLVSAHIESFVNSSKFEDLTGQNTGQEIPIDSMVNTQLFDVVEFLGSKSVESCINLQAFGAFGTRIQVKWHAHSYYNFNFTKFGGVGYWQEFRPQQWHVKRFGARIGDLDLSDRVTALSGNKSESSVYLSMTLAGVDLIDEINARSNEQIEFYALWWNAKTQKIDKENTLMTVNFDRLNFSRGGRSASMTLMGRANLATTFALTKHIEQLEYMSDSQWRAPVDLDLNVGDTAVFEGQQMTIGAINYTVGPINKYMTLSAAA